jgi:hypothetical protein
VSDKRKLYTIVGGGFSTNIKKALISFLYPVETDIEKIESIIPELVSGILKDAVIQDFVEEVSLTIPVIIGGELRELVINIPIVELVNLTIPSIVSAQLRDAIFYSAPAGDIDTAQLAIPPIVSGSFLTPVFYTEAPETVNLTIPALVSVSLV